MDDDLKILGVSRLGENQPEAGADKDNYADSPATPTEITIGGIWQKALDGIPIRRQDHFIVIGGDSLALAEVIMEIEKTFNIHLPIDVIANNLTLASMSATVDGLTDTPRKGTSTTTAK